MLFSDSAQGDLTVAGDTGRNIPNKDHDMTNRTRSRLPVSLFALIAAVALVAAACGDGDGGTADVASLENTDTLAPVAAGDLEATDQTEATTTTEALDAEEALLAFTQCMRDNGVEISDPEMDADGNLRLSRPTGAGDGEFDREAARAARDACSEFLDGVAQGFRNVDQTELQDNLLAYAQCIRDNGYEDMGDPDLSNFGPGAGPGQGGGPFGEIDREDPDFIAADEACRELLGGFGPGSGRGPGGGGGNG